MKKILIQYGVCALAVALMVPLAQAQAAFGKDAGTPAKKRRGEPVLVSPCTLCPPGFRPSLAGCVAGVKFLLLHLPPLASLEATCDEHNEATNKSLLRGPSIIFRGNGLARRVESPPVCKVVEKRANFLSCFMVEIIFDMEHHLAHVMSDNYPIRFESSQILSKHLL